MTDQPSRGSAGGSDRGSATGRDPETPELLPNLVELVDELIGEAHASSSGRATQSVMHTDLLRTVVIALRAGATLAEHEAPAAASLQVLRGEVTLGTGSVDFHLTTGLFTPIPHERHSVVAHQDSALLLTVATGR